MAIYIDGVRYRLHALSKIEGGPTVASAKRNSAFTVELRSIEEVDEIVVYTSSGGTVDLSSLTAVVENNVKVWSFKMRSTSTGTKNYAIVGYGKNRTPIAATKFSIVITR